MKVEQYASLPTIKLEITVDVDQRQAFLSSLREFASTHRFEIRIAEVRPGGEYFTGYLWRNDIHLFIVNAFNPTDFGIAGYLHKTNPASSETVTDLMQSLKSTIGGLSGVLILPSK